MSLKILLNLLLTVNIIYCCNANAESNFNADRHVSKGVSCQMCHGMKNEITEPSINECTKCHEIKSLVAKTSPKEKTGQNPHFSPHYQDQLECTNCHHGHQAPENFCDQCHQFRFNIK